MNLFYFGYYKEIIIFYLLFWLIDIILINNFLFFELINYNLKKLIINKKPGKIF